MFVKVVVLVAVFCSVWAEIPPYIKICKRNTPNLAECIVDSIYALRPKLVEGLPELGVPPFEPLPLDRVELRSGPRTAKIDANITNIRVWGPSEFQILEIKPNLAKKRFQFTTLLPHLYFKGDYDIDMNILVLKYNGKGEITGNFTNYRCDVLMKGHLIKKEGKQYLEFNRLQIILNVGQSRFFLDNLFNQDPNLARATHEVINENSDLFTNEVRPALEDGLSKLFTGLANSITTRFTYDELFPES